MRTWRAARSNRRARRESSADAWEDGGRDLVRRRWFRSWRGWSLVAVVALVALVVAARAYAPIAVRHYVNRTLARSEGYEGRIGDVDLNLWRGAYTIQNLDIVKKNGKSRVPLLRAPIVDLSIEWRALFDGAVVGEIWFEHPELNFVAGPPEERQSGVETDWREIVKKLFPVKINRLTVRDGSVHFRNFHTNPKVDVFLRDVNGVARNLTNSKRLSENMVAHASFSAVPMNAGHVDANLAIDPYAEKPSFDFDCKLSGVALSNFNDFFRAYAKVDIERGSLELVSELQAKDGSFHGYIKPFFEDVQVVSKKEAEEQSLFKTIWESIVGGAADVLKNSTDQAVATRIPISGTVQSPRMGFWPTLGNVLRNAFIQAFVPALENSVGEE